MIEVIQGEKQTVNIDLVSKTSGKPFDLTGASEIKVCFKSGSTIITKLLSLLEVSVVGDPLLGQITTDLSTTNTDAMTATNKGDIQVTVDYGAGNVKKAIINEAFSVTTKIC